MRSKNLFVAAVLTVSACSTIQRFNLKNPPDIDSCTLVWNGTLETSYGKCVSWNPQSSREYKISAEDLFKKKYIAMSARHESDAQKYLEYVENEARKRCD